MLSKSNQTDTSNLRHKRYEYRGFKGTVKQISYVFRKDYRDVKRLMTEEGLDLEDALEKARKGSSVRMTQDVFDGNEKQHDFILNQWQKELVERNLDAVTRYVIRKEIDDDDEIQELYMSFMYAVSKLREPVCKEQMSLMISQTMHATHLNYSRKKYFREDMFESIQGDLGKDLLYPDVIDQVYDRSLAERIDERMKVLDEQERRAFEMYCDAQIHKKPYTMIAEKLGLESIYEVKVMLCKAKEKMKISELKQELTTRNASITEKANNDWLLSQRQLVEWFKSKNVSVAERMDDAKDGIAP